MIRSLLLLMVLLTSSAACLAADDPRLKLPAHTRVVTEFGERPDISHDGKRILFLSKVFGDAMEIDLATGVIRNLTKHFHHHGFTRALYLANGDILLSGPAEAFDATRREDRQVARHRCVLSVLSRQLDGPPTSLGVLCSEGPAVSRSRMHIAWTHLWRQHPEKLKEGESQIYTGDIVMEGGKPRLANERLVLDSRSFPHKNHSFETQNFTPPADDRLVFTIYQLDQTANTETYTLDLASGELVNQSHSPDHYEEAEGVFPDGKATLVERGEHRGKPWPLIDLYKLALDGSGRVERLTHFTEHAGYKAAQGVISDDGSFMAFQIGKAGEEAGVGHGILIMKLR